MKLVRHGHSGEEKPGILDENSNIRDLSHVIPDINPDALAKEEFLRALKSLDLNALPFVEKNVRLGACLHKPGKVICVGYNSKLHAMEMGVTPLVNDMVVFLKPSSAVCGPNDPIFHTRHTKKLDWEAELAIVIAKQGKYISKSDAKNYIFGYACMNDLSERYLQLETCDTQYTKGKGFDNAAPIGPYLVTKDEISQSNNLHIQLWVNNQLRQNFNTVDYIHNDEAIVSYLSQYFTLYPGDIISMGSAPGSARSWGEQYLKPGDKVRLSIEGLGTQEQDVIVEP